MKLKIYNSKYSLLAAAFLTGILMLLNGILYAQDSTAETVTTTSTKPKPVKNTFQSMWLIDNQTVLVPIKGTLEMDIMHRFGVVNVNQETNYGWDNFFGFFDPSNIRLGLSYSPINKLNVGFGVTRTTATTASPLGIKGPLLDGSAKYSIITQTKGVYPVSVTYYGNAAYNTKKGKTPFKYLSDRFSFFNQILIARKITDKLSIQIAPSLSHQNTVNGYYHALDSAGVKKEVLNEMKHNHFSISGSARYKLTDVTSLMLNYDQPLTKHKLNNPNPNLSFGVEFNTSSHSFQLFFTNYFYLNPQTNSLYNFNSPVEYDDLTKTHPFRYTDDVNTTKDESIRVKRRYIIGFNITRLWNY